MDPSKLPSMSRTPRPPDESPSPPAGDRRAVAPATDAAGAWLSLAIGAILLFVMTGPGNLVRSVTDPASLSFTDVDGSPIGYARSAFFPLDLGVTAFALLLLAEGVVLGFVRRRAASMAIVGAAAAVVALNVVAIALAWDKVAFPLMNAVAAAFAGYVAIQEWGRVRAATA